ncbi:MAG: pilus assembly protein PilM [Candidatus Krumholzibacteriota bacterium]|nr:pilus assembly protein PilM [Candidatus Krumholzibacteriota bacterium]
MISIAGHKRVLGIDMSPRFIKLVEVESGRGGIMVLKTAIDRITEDDEDGGPVRYAERLKGLIRNNGIKAKKAFAVLMPEDVIERFVSVPAEAGKKIREIIEWEVPKHIDYSMEETVYDYNISEIPDSSRKDVHLAIARRDRVEKLASIIQEADLCPEGIESRSSSLCRLMNGFSGIEKKTVAILDIEHRWSTLLILRDKVLIMSRRIENGTNDILESISSLIGCSEHESRVYMMETGFSEPIINGEEVPPLSLEYTVYSAIERSVDRLVADLKRSYEIFKAQNEMQNNPDIIYLTGGTSLLPNIDRVLQIKMGIETEVLDPFGTGLLSDESGTDSFAQLTVALGLAIRSR